jgi:hypothetical protein
MLSVVKPVVFLGWIHAPPVAALTMRLIVDTYLVLDEVSIHDDVILCAERSETHG